MPHVARRTLLAAAAMTTLVGDVDRSAVTTATTGSDATVNPAGPLDVTKVRTPFDGVKVATSTSVYTPLWSTRDHTYVTEPCTVDGAAHTRLARLSPSGEVQQDVHAGAADDGGVHDEYTGHRLASVAVSDAGTLVFHPERHGNASPWNGRHSTRPYDVTSLVRTPTPAGTDTGSSYRRFYRDPWTGDLWLTIRGNDYHQRIFRWDESGTSWELRGADPLTTTGSYGFELAFGDGVVYLVTEYRVNPSGAQSGFPRRDIAVLRSTDSAATWQALDGTPVAMPLDPGAGTMVYPGAGAVGNDVAANHTGVMARVMVDGDNRPVVVAAWKHPTLDATYRSLWVTSFDAAGTPDRRRLQRARPDWSTGNAWTACTRSGVLMVTASERDDHLPDAANTSASEVDETNYPDSALHLYTSTDAVTWNRYTLDDGTSGHGYSGAFLDPESQRTQGVVKLTPLSQSTPSASEVWSFALPEPPPAGAPPAGPAGETPAPAGDSRTP